MLGHLFIHSKNKEKYAKQFKRITRFVNQLRGVGLSDDAQAETISIGDNIGITHRKYKRPFLTSPLASRGEICPLGEMFTPSFTPRDEHSLLFGRMEETQRITSPPGDKIHP
jgi:hypothetical protein